MGEVDQNSLFFNQKTVDVPTDESLLIDNTSNVNKKRTGVGSKNLSTRNVESNALRTELDPYGVSYTDPTEGLGSQYVFDPDLTGPPMEESLYPGSTETRVTYGEGFDPTTDVSADRGYSFAPGQDPQDPMYQARLFGEDVDYRKKQYEKAQEESQKIKEIGEKIRSGEYVSAEENRLYTMDAKGSETISEAKSSLEDVSTLNVPGTDFRKQSIKPRSARFEYLFEPEFPESSELTGMTNTGQPAEMDRLDVISRVTNKISEMNNEARDFFNKHSENKAAIETLQKEEQKIAFDEDRQHSLLDASGSARQRSNINRQIQYLRTVNANYIDSIGELRKDRDYLTYTLRREYGYFE